MIIRPTVDGIYDRLFRSESIFCRSESTHLSGIPTKNLMLNSDRVFNTRFFNKSKYKLKRVNKLKKFIINIIYINNNKHI